MPSNPAQAVQGPIFIGIILNTLLYGIMIGQTFLYFTTYKRDALWVKLFVAFLILADTVNSVFDLVYIYNCLINHFGDVEYLTNMTLAFETDPAMTGIIGSSVQLFFAWRVHVISNSLLAVIAIVICAVANLLASIGTAIGDGIVLNFMHLQKLQVVVIIWLAAAAVGDVLISSTLVWHLSRRKTGYAPTDDLINRIMRLTVQTGLITAVCAVVDLVFYLTNTNGIHLIFNIPLAKLYSNSLLSSLNCRGGWKFAEGATETLESLSIAFNIEPTHHTTEVVQVQTLANAQEVHVLHITSHAIVELDPGPHVHGWKSGDDNECSGIFQGDVNNV